MDELRIFLEVEAWEVCPVHFTFTIHKLRVPYYADINILMYIPPH